MHPIELFLISLALYLAVGVAFGFFFVWSGSCKIDKVAQTTSIRTRLLFFPGAALLWPILISKLLSREKHP